MKRDIFLFYPKMLIICIIKIDQMDQIIRIFILTFYQVKIIIFFKYDLSVISMCMCKLQSTRYRQYLVTNYCIMKYFDLWHLVGMIGDPGLV